jgi:PAS domain S-box-containing protein
MVGYRLIAALQRAAGLFGRAGRSPAIPGEGCGAAAEERLSAGERRYAALLEYSAAGLFVLDVRSDGSIVYADANPTYYTMTGLSAAEMIGKRPEELFAPDLAAVLNEHYGHCAATGEPVEYELSGMLPSGFLTRRVKLRPQLDASGRTIRIYGVGLDMTEVKRLEQALHQSQRMEAIGQLTGGVAHDFNNLLTVVTGNLDMIMRTPGIPERVERLARSAMKATMRGERLTRQLLMFARRETLHPETVNLNKLIQEFEGLLRRAAGAPVELSTQLSPTLDPCHVDSSQFEAAILNLIVNARDAMPNGGKATIETRNVELDRRYARSNPQVLPGSYVMVAVSDTGAGIAPDVLPRVFDPFFTTKDVGKGSGLGLSQVYGFATESGGHVKIYSEAGSGTTVKMYLPKSTAATRSRPRLEAEAPSSAIGTETVLLVEDDAELLRSTSENLQDLGYVVIGASDAAAALKLLGAGQAIDLLFSDVVLPGGINGLQLSREARRLRPGIKVLLTSGYSGTILKGDGSDNILPFISKPYRRTDLANRLRAVLDAETPDAVSC